MAQKVTFLIFCLSVIGCESTHSVGTECSSANQEPGLAFHQFVPVGQTVCLGNIGTVLETLQGSDLNSGSAETIRTNADTGAITCQEGGIGCLRARYRDSDSQNEIQTKCFVCIDETGDCTGQTQVALNLETFLPEGTNPEGDANFLAQGEQLFYGVCLVNGRYRLAQNEPALPPPFLLIPDALVDDHPYAFGSESFDLQRNASLTTYSGEEIETPWMIQLGFGLDELVIEEDGSIQLNDPNCDNPDCSDEGSLVGVDDVVIIGFGPNEGVDLSDIYQDTSTATLGSFIAAHNIASWDNLVPTGAEDDPRLDVRRQIVYRLISLLVNDRALSFYDELYDLRGKETPICLNPYWETRYSLSSRCHPDDIEVCEELSAELEVEEERIVEGWKNDGFDIWSLNNFAFQSDGTYASLLEELPDYRLFNGVCLLVSSGRPLNEGLDRTSVFADAIGELAAEVGDLNLSFLSTNLPITNFDTGVLCEAEVCPSDFTDYFLLYETILFTLLESFDLDQITGLGIPLFDGAHFDIREPYETKSEIPLNRVGESGFNNPLVNIYLSQ